MCVNIFSGGAVLLFVVFWGKLWGVVCEGFGVDMEGSNKEQKYLKWKCGILDVLVYGK